MDEIFPGLHSVEGVLAFSHMCSSDAVRLLAPRRESRGRRANFVEVGNGEGVFELNMAHSAVRSAQYHRTVLLKRTRPPRG